VYLRIAAIARLRNRRDEIGLCLRRGRQYQRETAVFGGFSWPGRGELVAWSRLLFQQEVVVALNAHGAQGRGAAVTVDRSLHPDGSALQVLYRSDWSDAELRAAPQNETVMVQHAAGRATVRLDLPPAGMMILAKPIPRG
jgi:hypothetical protein